MIADFDVCPAAIPEVTPPGALPQIAAMKLAADKARHIYRKTERPTIAADTIVSVEGELLGKPADEDAAFSMLKRLSGRAHTVVTGLCIIKENASWQSFSATRVFFAPLRDEQILAYIATGEPMDKAGAYGIQGQGGLFIPRIEGCYYNVVGLPLARLAHGLQIMEARA